MDLVRPAAARDGANSLQKGAAASPDSRAHMFLRGLCGLIYAEGQATAPDRQLAPMPLAPA